MRETTPCVTQMVLPPMGKPTTCTEDCRVGRSTPHSAGVTPSQNVSSSSSCTVTMAKSTW